MLSQPKNDEAKAEQTEATDFLREALKDGERFSKDVQKEARDNGITQYALRKARAILGVESVKKGGNFGGEKGWYMRLSGIEDAESDTEDDDSDAEDADSSEIRHLQPSQSDKTSYINGLTEFVENVFNQHPQKVPATSSNGLVPHIRMEAVCKCGADGFVGETCQKCKEIIISF